MGTRTIHLIAVAAILGIVHTTAQAQQPAIVQETILTEPPVAMEMFTDNGASDPARWYSQAEVLIMDRNVGSGAAFVNNLAGTATQLSARNLSFDWSTGPRFVVGRNVGDDYAVEAIYWGLYDMSSALADVGPGVPSTAPFTASNFSGNYDSNLHNAEFNVRRRINDNISFLAGLRYVSFNEDSTLNFLGFLGAAAVPFKAELDTHNYLYGAQVGGNWTSPLVGRMGVDAGFKTGIFGNDAGMIATTADTVRGFLGTGANTAQTSFLGELRLVATYSITDNLFVRAGYQMVWIEGIALIPDQIVTKQFNGTASTVDPSGGIFLHGAVAGLEMRW